MDSGSIWTWIAGGGAVGVLTGAGALLKTIYDARKEKKSSDLDARKANAAIDLDARKHDDDHGEKLLDRYAARLTAVEADHRQCEERYVQVLELHRVNSVKIATLEVEHKQCLETAEQLHQRLAKVEDTVRPN